MHIHRRVPLLLLAGALTTLPLSADLTYVRTTRHGSEIQVSKRFYKGHKMAVQREDRTTIVDLDNRTVTVIHRKEKTYATARFRLPEATASTGTLGNIRTDTRLKETGRQKAIGGHLARQIFYTMDIRLPGQDELLARMEAEVWVAREIPGAKEMAPMQLISESILAPSPANDSSGLGKSFSDFQRAMDRIGGTPLSETVRVQLGEKLLLNTTSESSDFSSAAIPSSVFAVPAGYRRITPERTVKKR